MRFEELDRKNQGEVRSLILAGLADHWDSVDPTLNPDLDDMTESYRDGRTVLARDPDGSLLGTGSLLPRSDGVAEIVRMSVATPARRRGIGRKIVEELLSTAMAWGVDTVILETTSTWEDVVAFYLECGFVITHVEESPFGDNTWFERHLVGRERGA